MFLNINMYKYSDAININHPNISNINLNCDSYGEIRYDAQIIPNEKELLYLARNEYDYRKLPCDGNIKLHSSFDKTCVTQYNLKPFDLTQIIQNGHDGIDCIWMQIKNLFQVDFEGNYFDKDIIESNINIYNKSLSYKLIFQFNSVEINGEISTNDRAVLICNTYFGTINVTEDTLISMNSIFEYVLLLIDANDSYPIHDIIHSPFTILSNDEQLIACTTTFSYIDIIIDLTLSSEKDESIVNHIFNDNGICIFVYKSEELLSKYFDAQITINNIYTDTIITETKGINMEYFVIVAVGSVFIIILILSIFLCKRRKSIQKLRALTTIITNPLVIAIAIGKYNNNTNEKDADIFFNNLDSIDQDIIKYS